MERRQVAQRGGEVRHLVGHGLDILHDHEQQLLLELQDGVLLPQLLMKLGWVCWLHGGYNVLLCLTKEQDADQGECRECCVYSSKSW